MLPNVIVKALLNVGFPIFDFLFEFKSNIHLLSPGIQVLKISLALNLIYQGHFTLDNQREIDFLCGLDVIDNISKKKKRFEIFC